MDNFKNKFLYQKDYFVNEIEEIKKLDNSPLYQIIVHDATEENLSNVCNGVGLYIDKYGLNSKIIVTDERIKFVEINENKNYVVTVDGDEKYRKMVEDNLKGFKDINFTVICGEIKEE